MRQPPVPLFYYFLTDHFWDELKISSGARFALRLLAGPEKHRNHRAPVLLLTSTPPREFPLLS